MHLADFSVGAMVSNAIVGANIPIATGSAMAFRLQGLDRVAVSFFGDGASNIGAFHEGLNLAAVQDAPVSLRLREQSLRRLDAHFALRHADHRHCRPRGRLRHARRRGRRHGRRGGLSRRRATAVARARRRRRADAHRVQDLSLSRPLARRPRRLPRRATSMRPGWPAIRSSGCDGGSSAISASTRRDSTRSRRRRRPGSRPRWPSRSPEPRACRRSRACEHVFVDESDAR